MSRSDKILNDITYTFLCKNLSFIVCFFLIISCQSNFSNTYIPDKNNSLYTYIEKMKPDRNFSNDKKLSVSNFFVSDSITQEHRALIKIRCSSIPIRAVVDSAFLYLYVYKFNPNNKSLLSVKRITENWDLNTVNWNNQPNTSDDDHHIVKIDKNVNYLKIDVTNFIDGLVKKKYLNHGLLLKVINCQDESNLIEFFSNKTRDFDSRPKLKVYFKD